jgi:hypothetical protein
VPRPLLTGACLVLTTVAAVPALVGSALALSLWSAAPAEARDVPRINHVLVIVLENKNYDETFDPEGDAPYLAKTLPSEGVTLENYYATGHLSLDNYISMVSGQGPNIQTQADCQVFSEFLPATPTTDGQFVGQGCVYPATVPTVADQLEAEGLRWRGYMQHMAKGEPQSCRHPAIGAVDDTQSAEVGDQYAARHNPFVYFHSIIDEPSCATRDVDMKQMWHDLKRPRTTPAYGFITPNLCNDGHDAPCVNGRPGGLKEINHFLKKTVPRIRRSAGFRDRGLLLITFDEAEAEGDGGDATACCNEQPGPNTPNPGGLIVGPGGGRIGLVALSPCLRRGRVVAEPFNHYSQLRSVEDLFGLDHLGFAGQAGLKSFNAKLFKHSPCA